VRLINCDQTLDINQDKLSAPTQSEIAFPEAPKPPLSNLTQAVVVTWRYLHHETEESFSTLEVAFARIYLQTLAEAEFFRYR
jgi:hypothetical protein